MQSNTITTNWMRAADTKVLQKMRYNIDLELKRRKDEERKNGPRFIFEVSPLHDPTRVFLYDLAKQAKEEKDPILNKAFNRLLHHNNLSIVTLLDLLKHDKKEVILKTTMFGPKLYDLVIDYICKCGYAYWTEVNP